MLLLLFIVTYDSLPPLPDLSKINFPEPPLWIEPIENYLIFQGYAGEFYGGSCDVNFQRFNVSAFYEQKNEWDTTKSATITSSYSIPLSRLWLKPAIHGFYLQRNDEYKLLTPSLDFSSTLPWALIFGEFNYDLWQINNRNHTEHEGKIAIIFDQTAYLPHFEISEVYTGDEIKPAITGKLHVRNFHVALGTPMLYGFFSPHLEIQYLDPKIKIETKFTSGPVYTTLRNYFDHEIPIKYRAPVPDESLKIGIDIDFTLDLYEHLFGLYSSFRRWSARLIPASNFRLVKLYDVQEANFSGVMKNNFSTKLLNISNALHVQYNWTDIAIPLLPKYTLVDTVSINFGLVEISSDFLYLSRRDGVNKKLPHIIIINPTLGLKFKFLKIFMKLYNITNEKTEIFDDYTLTNRQYTGGLEINYRF